MSLLKTLPFLFLFLGSPLLAQGNGVTLLSNKDEFSQFNDIWGYTAPNGDEYAIIGTTGGTAIYNAVDPTAPYLTGFITGPSSLWRDMKTYDHYAYVVTEGGGGVQIIDLANPEAPVLLKTWGAGIFTHSHNIAIDTDTGTGYACGTNIGMVIFDLSADPANPVQTGVYNAHYVHDLHPQHGLAHLAAINNGFYRIITIPGLATLDQVTTPGSFSHSAWANATDTIVVTTDETAGGMMTLYDVSNPSNIQFLSTFSIDPSAIIHNAFIKGDRVYASWYTAGFGVVDISDPLNPTVVGTYDTNAASGSSFDGAWGCYPFAPSGVVYISDLQNGLFILRVDGPSIAISHTPLANTQDETGPYTVDATITSLNGGSIASAAVHYSVNGGAETVVPMASSGGGLWSADIPGQISPASVAYHIEATDNSGIVKTEPLNGDFTFLVGIVTQLFFSDFEGPGDQGWTHAMVQTQDDWQRGTPAGKSGNSGGVPWSDPASAFSGSSVWGNDLGPSGWNGQYQPSVRNWLESPSLDLTGETGVRLRFQRWLTVENGTNDQAMIKVNGVVVWQNPTVAHPGGGGHILDTAWKLQDIDISAQADNNPDVKVRFVLVSDNDGIELGGWNIDDFEIVSLGPVGPPVDTIALSGDTTVQVGNTASFSWSQAPPLSPYWFYLSKKMNGSTVNGHPFDIGPGLKILKTGTTDGAGAAGFTSGPVKARFANKTFHLEVRVDSGGQTFDSNPLTINVLP